jgi:hypothetical protein
MEYFSLFISKHFFFSKPHCLMFCLILSQALALERKELHADIELLRESINPSLKQINEYVLLDLQPNSFYEVKISYPATNPADFRITFVEDSKPNTQRNLLNIEKVMFRTDEHGLVVGHEQQDGKYVVKVECQYGGVSVDPAANYRVIYYNIVLESLMYGVPKDTVWIVGVTIISLILVTCIFIPQILPLVMGFNSRRLRELNKNQ